MRRTAFLVLISLTGAAQLARSDFSKDLAQTVAPLRARDALDDVRKQLARGC